MRGKVCPCIDTSLVDGRDLRIQENVYPRLSYMTARPKYVLTEFGARP